MNNLIELSDSDVRARSANVQWRSFIHADSGEARKVALVMAQSIPDGQDDRVVQHVEHYLLDASIDPDEWAKDRAAIFNKSLRSGEMARSFVRSVDLGPAQAHVFVRMAMSCDEGELFKCSSCGMVVAGRANLGYRTNSPYTLSPPKEATARRRFFENCRAAD